MEEDINEKNTGHRVTAKEIPPGSEILEESKDLSDQRKWPQKIGRASCRERV